MDLPEELDPDYFTNSITLRRFLIGKQFRTEVMWEQYTSWVKWYIDKKPYLVKEYPFWKRLRKQGCMNICGIDKNIHPILIVKIGNFIPDD